jgi:hypothetical protein
MKSIQRLLVIVCILVCPALALSEELPRPTYDNSTIFAVTYSLSGSSAEINYIKSQFGNGIYAPLYLSNFVMLEMDWATDPADAENNIQAFKNSVENLISQAKSYAIGLHVIVNYGLVRYVNTYKSAKEEDIRNAQWYNDNNLAAADQLSGTMNEYVFGTYSRYARKLREFHEAKVAAMFSFMKDKQDENPDLIIIFSGTAEAELNYHRIDNGNYLQTDFCDYSPFVVLEFRDWIRHAGMYGPGGRYEGEGYTGDFNRYQGASGLAMFNSDFGTGFTSWDLKYYNWSLNDTYEAGAIPFAGYSFGGQMPGSGPHLIAGGFDPPRVMQQDGLSAFWDLWHAFRELLVAHYVKDMASITLDSGFPKEQYFTHQIPADYLFGTRPDDPLIPFLNPRYYSSASPMWTANAFPDMGMAITLYDLKTAPDSFLRTSKYAVEAIAAMSSNWAALEYNPEVHPWTGIPMGTVDEMYAQMIRLYEHNAHAISFYNWLGGEEWQYKGTNRELAAVRLFDNIKDCARQPVGTLFTPPAVPWLNGGFNPATGEIDLDWSEEIWDGLSHQWSHWDGFKEFALYRGYTPDFVCDLGSEIARGTPFSYSDDSFSPGSYVYYKIAAVNIGNESGPLVSSGPIVPEEGPIAVLDVSRTSLIFAGQLGGTFTSPQNFMVLNKGTVAMGWIVIPDSAWLSCTPALGTDNQVATVSVEPSGLSIGTYSGTLTVSAAGAYESPRYITVTLKVLEEGNTQPPIGYWDTPVDGASQVRGQIPVTGWALDDVEVDRVEIWRRAEPEDPPGAIAPDGLVLVGDALFVEGARPNLETDPPYNEYPYNYKGGWGYMMLTYGLPRRGSGGYVLHAFVWDTDGNKTDLGTKAITCDNENAIKPFGTLDTPAPGMVFPDPIYGNINFGWVLTPQPKIIPFDGSTIFVYIDGLLKGNLAEYGNYSSSVATMFPGYANTNNSYGHYFIDLGSYENGVHTIQWTAYDSDGIGEGIGSRYFNIQNTDSGVLSRQALAQHQYLGRSLARLNQGSIDISEPVRVRHGYGHDNDLEAVYADTEGVFHVEMEEVDRIELHLSGAAEEAGQNSSRWFGYQVIGDQLRKLPVGSTFNPDGSTFFWLPGAGFLGEYNFVFMNKSRLGICRKIRLVVTIVPKNELAKHGPEDSARQKYFRIS